MRRAKLTHIEESVISTSIDEDAKIIHGVVLLSNVSKNGRTYTNKALSEAASLLENSKVYLDHKSSKSHRVERFVGRAKSVNVDGNRVRGNVAVTNHKHWQMLSSIAENDPTAMGMSIDANGAIERKKNGPTSVVEVNKINSVDFVSDPATTTSLFEEIKMDWSDVNADDLKEGTRKIVELLKEDDDIRAEFFKSLKNEDSFSGHFEESVKEEETEEEDEETEDDDVTEDFNAIEYAVTKGIKLSETQIKALKGLDTEKDQKAFLEEIDKFSKKTSPVSKPKSKKTTANLAEAVSSTFNAKKKK